MRISAFLKAYCRISLVVALLSFVLSGCSTLMDVTLDSDSRQNIAPPSAPPKIIYGQKAYVRYMYGDEYRGEWAAPSEKESQINLDVWRKTGLFSSVEQAPSRKPPLNGVLIVQTCSSIGGNRYPSFLAAIPLTFSLGLIPVITSVKIYCEIEFHQNGKRLAKDHFAYKQKYMHGLWMLAFNDEEFMRKRSQMCANNLLSKIK